MTEKAHMLSAAFRKTPLNRLREVVDAQQLSIDAQAPPGLAAHDLSTSLCSAIVGISTARQVA